MASLYIHIPFCASRCNYCDFYSTTSVERVEEYVAALCREMRDQAAMLPSRKLDTVYFGGGTPSQLSASALGAIWEAIARKWDISALKEATLEANPDDLSQPYLAEIARLPFDRLSIGVQSLDDRLLHFMGRRHTARAALNAIDDARAAGFGNISVDLIYGIPGMTRRQWLESLRGIADRGVEHISAYHLTIEPDTPFGRRGLTPIPEQQGEEHYRALCRALAYFGYEHYEISNFARPGRRAVHNSAYWSGAAYLGLGPGAHSFDGACVRRWCDQPLTEYIAGVEYRSETLTEHERYNEYVMTSLRTSRGVDAAVIAARFGARRLQYFTRAAQRHIEAGALVPFDGRYFIPEDKFLISDTVIASLFA